MRVSQVLHRMDKDETVCIIDSSCPVDNDVIYIGEVRGVHRDSPLNRLGVDTLFAVGDVIYIDVANLADMAYKKPLRTVAELERAISGA